MGTNKTRGRKPSVRTKVHHITMQHMQKENRRKPSVFAGFWQGQKDLSRLPPRSGLDAAHRAAGPHDTHCAGAQPCLVAESLCALTKKERQADACLSFLAGAEGLEPSARGFGVDVGTNHRERGKTGVTRFLPQVTKRAVLVWCCVEKPSCRER